MSPLLFNLFINDIMSEMNTIDIPDCNESTKGFLFADDLVLFSDTKEDLRDKLRKLETWMTNNLMDVNLKKCGVMSMRRTKIVERIEYKNSYIEGCNSYKYLGVTLNRKLNMDEIANVRISIGQNTLSAISSKLKNNLVPIMFKKLLIKNLLMPRMCYGIQIYGMRYDILKELRRYKECISTVYE